LDPRIRTGGRGGILMMKKTLIVCLILGLALMIPAASADYTDALIGNFSMSKVLTYYEYTGGSGTGSTPLAIANISFADISTYPKAPLMLKVWFNSIGPAFNTEIFCKGSSPPSGGGVCGNSSILPVIYKALSDNSILGTGYTGYNINLQSNMYYWASINTWNIGTKTGPTEIVMVFNQSEWYIRSNLLGNIDLSNPFNVTFKYRYAGGDSPVQGALTNFGNPGREQFDSNYYFENSFQYDNSSPLYDTLNINRVFDHTYPSYLSLSGYENGTFNQYIMNSYGANQIFIPNIPKGVTDLHLQITDLVGNNYHAYWNRLRSQPNVTINLDVKNAITGALITDADVGIHDDARGIWRNSTAPTGQVYFTTTGTAYEYPIYIGESITLAAGHVGFSPAWVGFSVYDTESLFTLSLVPNNIPILNGTFNLIVTVTEPGTISDHPIQGASVSLDTGEMKATNTAGASTFYNVTAGNRSITASKSGYNTREAYIVGLDGETHLKWIVLTLEGTTPAPTATTATTDPNQAASGGILGFINWWDRLSGLIALIIFMYFVRKVIK
jgi:hypothetical protein